jgi:hypothetical protein
MTAIARELAGFIWAPLGQRLRDRPPFHPFMSSSGTEKRSPRSRLRHGRRILDVRWRQDFACQSAISERGSSRRITCHAALLPEQPAHPRVTNRRRVRFDRGLRFSATELRGGNSQS